MVGSRLGSDICTGEHRYFVSEVKGSSSDEFVWVVKVCTACPRVERVKIPLDPDKPLVVESN